MRLAIAQATATKKSIIARGAGFSYGDPALNDDGLVLDVTRMNRILAWSGEDGLADVEPGVTVQQLCSLASQSGWWPPVVPGTQSPTIGGCLAANVHGKNNWISGTFGEHVDEIDVVLADGKVTTCGPNERPELYRAIVGGFGLFGVITRARLRLMPSSGLLRVDRYSAPSLESLMSILRRHRSEASYVVGWIDGYATRDELGRGLTQIAYGLPPRAGIHAKPARELPRWIRSNLWIGAKPFANDRALKRLNAIQYSNGAVHSGSGAIISRSRFDFFHDTVPDWNRAFSHGIFQYQMFVPEDRAEDVFRTALERAIGAGFPPFLVVLKLHRTDDFVLSEGVDGFSLSMDFSIGRRRGQLTEFLGRLTDEVVLPSQGRFYLAKDNILTADQFRRSVGDKSLEAFLRMKRDVDPSGLFRSDMYDRLFSQAVVAETEAQT